ncbi:hypothetical protein [Microbacterium paraoxydans]|uniref:hypothetical protein n=1 Tax=Microbacterium paraoxydans TaxID=199592 RepID=UPI003D7113C1
MYDAPGFGERGFLSFLRDNARPSGEVDRELLRALIPDLRIDHLPERIDPNADGLFHLAAVVWDVDERLALSMFREAASAGSWDALAALGEGENWLGDHDQAVVHLRAALDRRPDVHARLEGLLGESLALSTEPGDPREIERLLTAGLRESPEFALPLARLLLSEGLVGEGRAWTEWAVEAEVYGAALLLGNLLSETPDSTDAAEAAYWRGIATGDAHSAHNLAVVLQQRGDEERSRELHRLARSMGDPSPLD